VLLRRNTKMLRDWSLLNKPEDAVVLEQWATELERRSFQPPRLVYIQMHQRSRPDQSHVSDSSAVGVCDVVEVSKVVVEHVGLMPDGTREL
jgi:hypothetical protein